MNFSNQDTILVTGGAGFIGANFVLDWISKTDAKVVNLDLLTYAGNLENLKSLNGSPRHQFVNGDIADKALVLNLLNKYQPRAIVNFAAESHVDRSIADPSNFINTNIIGTYNLLEISREYWSALEKDKKQLFRFLHVSTDEVYGSLVSDAPAFAEDFPYKPNSPYSASKAASDHLVRAWYHTYGLPTIITNCSNNYGPLQYPEKLIPLIITNAISGKLLPIYGDGKNIRDWLFVGDHCDAIRLVLENGQVGENYNIGGNSEKTNIDVVHTICSILDQIKPADLSHPITKQKINSYSELITFVDDRLGHDKRYAMNITKIHKELMWSPKESFETGIRKTVSWYAGLWNN